jgi:hypothetical protein
MSDLWRIFLTLLFILPFSSAQEATADLRNEEVVSLVEVGVKASSRLDKARVISLFSATCFW